MAASTKAWFIFGAKDGGLTSGLNRMENRVGMFSKRSKRNISELGSELSRLSGKFTGLAKSLPLVGGLSAAGIFYGAKGAIEKFAKRESTEVAIKYISGNAENAATNLKFLKDITNEMGIAYEQAADGFKRFTGSMMGQNIPFEKQRDQFRKITTAIRVMGLDEQATESVYRAFSEMISKGKMQAQELRTQLSNALFGAMPMLAESMNKNMGQLDEMLQKGAITTEKYMDGFLNLMESRYLPGLDKASQKTVANLMRVKNQWDMSIIGIGGALVDAGVVDHVINITKATEDWVTANKELISVKVKKFIDGTIEGFGWIKDNWGSVKNGLEQVALGVGTFIAVFEGAKIATMLTNPIYAATAGVILLTGAVAQAILEFKKLEKQGFKDPSGKLKSMSAGAQLMGGVKAVGEAASGTLGGGLIVDLIQGKDPTKDFKKLNTGISMIGKSFSQSYMGVMGYFGDEFAQKQYVKMGREGAAMSQALMPRKLTQEDIKYGLQIKGLPEEGYNANPDYRQLSDSVKDGMLEGFATYVRNIPAQGDSSTPIVPSPLRFTGND